MSVDYVQLPPDSSGKRVHQKLSMEVSFTGGTIDFAVGDIVTGATSGVSGVVEFVEGTTASGSIYLAHDPSTTKIFTASENLQVGGVTHAVFGAQANYYTQKQVLAGGNNPHNEQFVDNQGQGYVRFAEGAPQFDAFGKLRVSQGSTIREYIHDYGKLTEDFEEITANGGTITYITGEAGVKLSTTTTSGSNAKTVSHMYHPYLAGRSQLIEMTVAMGDSGKANVMRMWGYGDEDDGVFFRHNGTTMQVVIRNSTGSTAAEVAVDQADWDTDQLDGTGLSGFTLDISKNNIYWIDMQWLGAGQVRFGVVDDTGNRVVCHHQEHANKLNSVYMRTAALPIHFHQQNTGVAASTSEMKYFCAVVKTEAPLDGLPFKSFSGELPSVTCTGEDTYLGSFRPKQTFQSVDNRVIAFGDELNIFSDTEAVVIKLWKNPTLSGTPTWLGDPGSDSSVEFDLAATGISGGRLIKSWIVGTDKVKDIDLTKIFNFAGEMMRRHYTITNHDIYAFTVSLRSGTTTDVFFTANWKEFRH